MPNYLQDVDFTRNPFNIRLVLDLVFLKDFDGYFLTCDQMSSEPNFTESALAKRFAFNRKKISMFFIVTRWSLKMMKSLSDSHLLLLQKYIKTWLFLQTKMLFKKYLPTT